MQKEIDGSKKVSKKGGIIIAEREFDMSRYVTEETEEVSIPFPKTSKSSSKFIDVELEMKMCIYDTDKEIDAIQMQTRAASMQLSDNEFQSL